MERGELVKKIRDNLVRTSIWILAESLKEDDDLYAGFVCSIKSALDDIEGSMNHENTAKVILDRLVGLK